jgi:DNA replication protein DnaC
MEVKKYKCELCKDMEFIYNPVTDSAKECSCRQLRIQERRQAFADIPVHFSNITLDKFRTDVYEQYSRLQITNILKTVRCYIDEFEEFKADGLGLYIYSHTKGSGKTRLAVSIANELLKQGYKVKFATAISILNEIKASWQRRDSDVSESTLLNDLTQTDILVIDDFGQEKISEWVNNEFYHIINERYALSKVTIYTSNCELKELLYDERITSRINEKSIMLDFPEESVRDIIAKNNNDMMKNRVQEIR